MSIFYSVKLTDVVIAEVFKNLKRIVPADLVNFIL